MGEDDPGAARSPLRASQQSRSSCSRTERARQQFRRSLRSRATAPPCVRPGPRRALRARHVRARGSPTLASRFCGSLPRATSTTRIGCAQDRVSCVRDRAAIRRSAVALRAGTPRSDCRSRCAHRAARAARRRAGRRGSGFRAQLTRARWSSGAPAPPGATGLDRPTTARKAGAAQQARATRRERSGAREPPNDRAAGAAAKSKNQMPFRRASTDMTANARTSTSSHGAGRRRKTSATSGSGDQHEKTSSDWWSESGAHRPYRCVTARRGGRARSTPRYRGARASRAARGMRRRARRLTRAARSAPAGRRGRSRGRRSPSSTPPCRFAQSARSGHDEPDAPRREPCLGAQEQDEQGKEREREELGPHDEKRTPARRRRPRSGLLRTRRRAHLRAACRE